MKRWAIVCCFLFASSIPASEPIRLANYHALSPDGLSLAFDWNGDVWIALAIGGDAMQLTAQAARNSQHKFSPEGKSIAFISDRDGSPCAEPTHLLWLEPGALPQGRDAQLTKALEVLQADMQAWRDRPQPKLRKATERP